MIQYLYQHFALIMPLTIDWYATLFMVFYGALNNSNLTWWFIIAEFIDIFCIIFIVE